MNHQSINQSIKYLHRSRLNPWRDEIFVFKSENRFMTWNAAHTSLYIMYLLHISHVRISIPYDIHWLGTKSNKIEKKRKWHNIEPLLVEDDVPFTAKEINLLNVVDPLIYIHSLVSLYYRQSTQSLISVIPIERDSESERANHRIVTKMT